MQATTVGMTYHSAYVMTDSFNNPSVPNQLTLTSAINPSGNATPIPMPSARDIPINGPTPVALPPQLRPNGVNNDPTPVPLPSQR